MLCALAASVSSLYLSLSFLFHPTRNRLTTQVYQPLLFKSSQAAGELSRACSENKNKNKLEGRKRIYKSDIKDDIAS
jgi:hypothetical protein